MKVLFAILFSMIFVSAAHAGNCAITIYGQAELDGRVGMGQSQLPIFVEVSKTTIESAKSEQNCNEKAASKVGAVVSTSIGKKRVQFVVENSTSQFSN